MADFPSVIDLSAPGAGVDVLSGGEPGDHAGWSLAGAGDFNGDGIGDLLVGAPSDGSGAGRVWLVFGKAGGVGALDFGALTPDQGFLIAGAAPGDVAGWSVAAAGDLNHDGLADIVIGARLADAGGAEDAGRAYVIFGRPALAGPIDLAALDPGQGFAIDSGAAFDHAGWSVASAGDFNHDGIDDLLIGVPGADGAGLDRGAAWVLFGHDGAFGDIDLRALGGDGFAIAGAADYDEAGRSLASAGDVNGDGFDDIIVGAAHAGAYAGAAWVVFGGAGGAGAIDLGALAPGQGFAILGAGAEQAGFSVASAGDVNGDGFGDLILGAPYADYGAGRAYLIFGHGGTFGTIDLAALTEAEGFVISGAAAGDHAGWSVAGGGDLNGDGFDDLAIGAPYADGDGGVDRGAAYVLFGHNGIFGPINLDEIPTNQGLAIHGAADYDQTGRSVVFSGDINNDGLDDLLVGAPYSGAGDSGGAYIIYGDLQMTTTRHVLSTGTFSQNWSNAGLITTDDNWSGVPSIVGYRGDGLTGSTGTNPTTITADGSATPVDVNANRSDPNTFGTGGIAEFDGIANPTVALQGSGTARAPQIVIYLDATGRQNIQFQCNLRDIDGSADNVAQQVAIQYRTNGGTWTNITGGYFSDVTTGGSATQVTAVNVTLPADANNSSTLEIRIMTTDAVGTDEWVGIDDIQVSSSALAVLAVDLDGTAGGINYSGAFTEGANAAIGNSIAVTEAALPIVQATVTLTDGIAGDALSVSGLPGTITVDPSSTATNLILVGTGTTAEWAAALGQVRYANSTDNPDVYGTDTARTINVTVSDGTATSTAAVATIAITAVNDAPALGGLNGDSVTFTEGDPYVFLDNTAPVASVTDPDNQNFSGGFIQVGVQINPLAEDEFFVVDGFPGVDVDGANVSVDGFLIGVIATSGPGQILRIDLNADATAERVATLLDYIAYRNVAGDNPTGGARSVTWLLNDGQGDAGVAVSTVNVTAVNDPPTVNAGIADYHSNEDAALSYQFPANAFADPDSTLTYTATLDNGDPLPGWLSFNSSTRTFSGTPPTDFNGTIPVKVTASDGTSTASDTFDLIIDPVPESGTLAIGDVTMSEGDAGATNFSFTVNRTSGSEGAVGATWTLTLSGAATAGDFTTFPQVGTVSFADGETVQTVTITVQGDMDVEPNETFTVVLSAPTGGATIGDDTGLGTITNDDIPPVGSVSIADVSIVEGNAGTSLLVFTVTRTGGTREFDVNFATSNGGDPNDASATAGSDYVAQSGTLHFADGQDTATISIVINGDTTGELDEEFSVTLSGVTNGGSLSDAVAIGTIENDDAPPTSVRLLDESFTTFTAGGFAPNPTASQVDSDIWRVVGLSDIPNPSYGFTGAAGTDFGRGVISGDPATAGVYSVSGNGAMILQPTAAELEVNGFIEARIQNTTGTTVGSFDVAFDWDYRNNANRGESMQLSYSTDGVNFTAVPAAAFTTPVALAAGAVFTYQHEAVSLTGLSVASGGFLYLRWTHLSSSGSGNRDEVGIDNVTVDAVVDASLPMVSVSDVSANEATGQITFTITRSNVTNGAFTVNYATANGTAIAGQDYDAASGTLSFGENQVQATVTVQVTNEAFAEFDETVFLNLSDAVGANIADAQGVGTIVNDDGPPITVSIGDVTVTEGDAGTSLMTFTVTRSGGTGEFDVSWQTANGTATEPSDYVAASGTLHFGVGQTTDTISITINGDTAAEYNEAFQVLLSGPTNGALITDGTGIGTIVNDDILYIHMIQGTSYFSPILAFEGITSFNTASTGLYTVKAIVTAVDNDGNRQGFYIQEEITDWDGNAFTSEGIFVMTRNDAGVGTAVSGVAVGDLVTVTAHVMEYRGFSSSMPITALTSPTSITVQSSGNTLPTLLLDSSVAMPTAIMTLVQPDYTDSADDVGDTFDASLYALSFWETVEGMHVTIPDMVVADGFVDTSGGQPFFQAYSQQHADADQINSRGGYTIAGDPPVGPPDTGTTEDDTITGGRHLSDGDVNPDIIEVDFTGFAIDAPGGLTANASMGDELGDVTGIIDFEFTDRKLFVTDIDAGSFVDHTTTQEITILGDDSRSLTVATFNVENLDPTDGAPRFAALAAAIANNLNMPDIISIEEMQDNNGAATGDGIDDDPITPGMQDAGGTDASQTWQMLVDALNALTGAHYQWVDEAPVYNAEGGEQSGNIRVGFLYNTDRVQLGDLDADATLAERRMYTDRIGDGVRDAGDLIAFSDNMLGGEIQTSDWSGTRRSLLGEFTFNGNKVYVTANHFPAKGGSDQFWAFDQNPANGEPTNSGWSSRNNVAQDVYAMLNLIETNAPAAGIVSGGDYNDFYFYRPLTTVTGYTMADGTARIGGARFDNLTLTLPMNERYTYNFDGRSQAIDHIIVDSTLSAVATYDVVHLNTGFNASDPTPLSDHDPGLSSFNFRNFSETLTGTAGADSIEGFGGNDTINGLGGTDTAVYAGNRADYSFTYATNANGVATGFTSVTDNAPGNGDEGADTLTSVERLQFADMTFDLSQRVQLFDGSGNLVGTFNDIQAAINAASDGYRIEAQAGIYNESLTVDRDVTIEGANAGTPGTGARVLETLITGQVTVSAAGVTIDGVLITGAEADALGTTGVVVEGGANDFSLVNSVLSGSGDLGMIVGLVTGIDVGHNLIEGYSTGMYVAGGGTTGSVHDNRFQGDGQSNGTGLINGLQSETSHVTISGNAFDALDGGSLFLFPFGPDTVDLDSYISGNTISNSGADRPIQILPTNLTHNVIGTDYNEAFDGETAALAGVTGAFSYDGQGGDDRAWGGGEGDTFTGGADDDWLFGNAGDDNAIYSGNRSDYTIILLSPGVFQITDDRPGSPDGTDRLEGVEYLQFADATLDASQRVQLYDGSNNLVATFNDIQAAIDAASDGYRIIAQAGDYDESLTVDKDVTIEGANAGLAGTDNARGPETVITGQVTISAAGVTIDGVEITGAEADALGTTGVVVEGGANNFSLVNSILASVTGDLGMIVGLVTGLDVGHNLIQLYATAMYVAGGNTTGSIHDNIFQHLDNGLLSETTHVTISGNTFDGITGGSLFLFPFGPDSVDLDSYIFGNTITDSGIPRPVQILPTNLTHNIIGTDFNEAFDGETAALNGVTGSFSYDGQGGDDHAWGGQSGDTLTGGSGADVLYGEGGDDTLSGGVGNDSLNGNLGGTGDPGTDTAVFAGNRAGYSIVTVTDANGVVTGFTSVTDTDAGNGDEGTDTLTSIERLQFADVTLDLAHRVQLFDGSGNLVGTFNDIQAAIDAAADGYRIEAQAGTYTENLNVDVDVTIEGANAGTAGTSGSRGAETVINGQITVSDTGVTIDGVRIIGSGPGALGTTGVVVESGANNFSLVNSILDGTANLGMIVGPVTGLNVGANLIEGYAIGIYVSGGETTGSVHDNRFQGDGAGSGTGLQDGLNSETTHVTISANTFDGIDGGSLFLFPSGPDSVDLDSYVIGNTFSNSGADRPIQILPTNLTHNVIGTDFNEAFDGETAALYGVTGSFSFDGQGGDDRAWGAGEIDTFTGGAGNDWLFGNAGDDNAIYSGNRSDYTVTLLSPGVIQITDDRPGSPDGTDRLEGVERVVFANNDYWVEANGTLSVINDAPLGVDHTLTVDEDVPHVFTVADFSFTEIDPSEANQLLEVTIVDLPAQGTIYYDADGAGPGSAVAISAGATFTAADLNAGRLTYVADLNENGSNYASFTYQVRDDGGTAHGGQDTDPVPNTITIDVNPVNDAPAGTNNTITFYEDFPHAFSTTDFGFSDTVEGDDFAGVVIASLPLDGMLLYDGDPVTVGQFVSADDIDAGLLTYVNALNENGDGYASFDFKVRDDGGTDHNGVDTDPSANTITFNVTPVDDEPTLTATPTNPLFLEGGARVDLFDGVAASTIEAGQTIAAMTLTVTNVTQGVLEVLRFDDTNIALVNGNSVTTATNGLGVTVTLSGSTATVSFSGASLSTAQLEALVDGLAYRNSSQNPTDADRVVTITQLIDSGANIAPDDNDAAPNLVSTVNVEPVNDAPSSALIDGDTRTYLEGGTPVTLDVLGNGTISDVDSADFGGGSLTLSIASALAEDNLLIIANASVTTSAGTVSVNGTPIGTFSGGSAGTALVISFNTDATPAAVQLLARALGYANSGGDTPVGGLRTVTWTLDDGDGTANGGVSTLTITSKVSVIPVNDAPSGADVTVPIDEDQTYHLQTSDFAFSDPENDQPGSLRIESLPSQGILYFDPDGAGPNAAFAVSPGLSVSWSSVPNLFYVPDPDSNGTDSFTFAVVDTGGAADTTPNTFTFNVAAVNDAAVITGDASGDVTEAGGINNGTAGTPTDTGDLDNSDVDNTNDGWQAVAAGAATANGYGTYGLSAAGVWTYTLDDSDAAVQALNGTDTLTDTFEALTEDGTSQTVTITIHAQNDVAIITGDASGDVTEAGGVNNGAPGTPTDSGDLDAADPDNTNDGWQAVAAGAATTGGYGTYSLSAAGVWTYTLDNGNAAVQALNGAATLTDSFTALTEEGTAQLVTITIHAQDDTPVARPDAVATNEATIVNGNVLANNGSGADSDVDGPALTVTAVNGSGAVGTQITLASGAKLTVNADGTFSYDPNHAFDNTPAPNSGASNQPAADSFTYTLAGGATATVSVSITGIDTNDLLLGTAGADSLFGGVGNDQLQGLGGDDYLEGGSGTDSLAGGAGNDTLVVEDETDAVIEAVGGGVDTVFARAGFTLGAGQEIEYLSAISQADTAAILLVGNEFSQFLYGNAGANYLDGGSGNDTLVGFGGDDSYVVDDASDFVAEFAGGG
ncbi:MAG TPA: Calx-beta domain-containing protein, partial [Allosphingosinicella sp.]|nr:Calx-beta domain-containing protein [Allosphingosinicella sp.]